MSTRAPIGGVGGGIHQPKINIKEKHRVVTFGTAHESTANDPQEKIEEDKLYCFRHQRADFQISEGVIPVGFLSKMWLEEGQPVFLQTRSGGWDDIEDRPNGPQYLVTWKQERQIVPPVSASGGDGWSTSLDELWIAVLSYFERKNLLSEDTLDYLDADPFVLFGLDNKITQQAIQKLQKFAALLCQGMTPSLEEWSYYLRIRPDDGMNEVERKKEESCRWLVRALAETELPKPWTCYKGVGSIVCYIRADTGSVTWKHPFYDYFRQLRDFCRQATKAEVQQVRVNRLLWQYEATRVETEHYQEPLVCPDYCEKLAEIFGFDIKTEGCIVRNLKAQLKVFAKTYRTDQSIDINDVVACAETLHSDVDKYGVMKTEWGDAQKEDVPFQLKELTNGNIACVHCQTTALCFCLECKDYLCLECYDKLHNNGAVESERRNHAPFQLVACSMCVTMPAKLHCTFTDKSICHECYAMKHIKLLPPDGKENQPRQIDYKQQYIRYATLAKERRERQAEKMKRGLGGKEEKVDESYDAVLSTDWHPFYDSRGVKYYHNFLTGERMRQSPRRVPNVADPGAPPDTKVISTLEEEREKEQKEKEATLLPGQKSSRKKPLPKAEPLALSGVEALYTGPRAVDTAEPESRNMRAPFRK
jgi:hypothetical protein